jgi:preprotein translocase subunit SecA
MAPLFRKAQRRVERRHSQDRRTLARAAKRRQTRLESMGQDPYLDAQP